MTEDEELEGMDTVLHGETAYEFGGGFGGGALSGQRDRHQHPAP